jgi:phosphoribosyl 1,2-cyclic phosphodiesterase
MALAGDGGTLLIDAGFSAREIVRRASTAGLDLSGTVGIVLTHEHGDHSAGVARLARQLGVPILASLGTWDRLRHRMPLLPFQPLTLMGRVEIGGYQIEACPISHDAAQPVALRITSLAGHRVAVAYDLGRPTTGVRYLLREAHAIVLEANHDDLLLRTSGYPPAVQQRIAGSGGHLSNRAAAELLGEVAHPALNVVVLAHLSARCNTSEHARAAVEPVFAGSATEIHVAQQDAPLRPIELRDRQLL